MATVSYFPCLGIPQPHPPGGALLAVLLQTSYEEDTTRAACCHKGAIKVS
jgi:hypothetical protein